MKVVIGYPKYHLHPIWRLARNCMTVFSILLKKPLITIIPIISDSDANRGLRDPKIEEAPHLWYILLGQSHQSNRVDAKYRRFTT